MIARLTPIVLLAVLLLSACGVPTLSAPYDRITDDGLYEIAYLTDGALSVVPGMSYDQASSGYAEVARRIRVLVLRAESRVANKIGLEQVVLIADAWVAVEAQHKKAGQISRAFADQARASLRQSIGAAMKLEIERYERGLR